MNRSLNKAIYLLLVGAVLTVFSSQNVWAEPSKVEQANKVIEKTQGELNTIRQKLAEKMAAQVQAGDKAGARNTHLRILAATDLANMLATDSKAGGVFFKLHLIDGFNSIINFPDFSATSFREVMNYRMIGPDQRYDNTHITEARTRIQSDKSDMQVLQALEDRAIYFASQQTYEDMHAGFQRGMAAVALGLNDAFADINPATSLLEAALGTKVSGEDIGKDMTAGERVGSLGKFAVEMVLDIGTDKVVRDATKGIGTRVGPGRGNNASSGKGKARVEVDADAPGSTKAPDSTPKTKAASGEEVIGHVNLDDVTNVDDMVPFTDLENFNIDLRTGQVTTSKNPGGRIGAADQAKIEAGLKPKGPLGGDQKIDLNQGTAATAVVKPPTPTGGEQVIGHVDLNEVNDVFDMVGLTHLENFNVDLRTGQVTSSPVPGGRIGAADQAKIEAGLKPQGPLGGDQKIDLDFQNATTQVDIQGMTTVNEQAVFGGTLNKKFADPQAAPGTNKPRDEIKPIWDLLDLIPEDSKQLKGNDKVLPIIIYVENPNGGPRMGVLLNIFDDGFGWNFDNPPSPAADPFGDCLGPQCVPSFGGPGQPFGAPPTGADFHSVPGGPGSQFVSDDSLLNDPAFFDQRFGELFDGASPTPDSQNPPN